MSEEETRTALDEAVRAHIGKDVDPDGEVVTSWLVTAATRRFDGGGVVIVALSDEAMPQWEARGLLTTALHYVDRSEDADQGEEG
jgi:hypothetical protein